MKRLLIALTAVLCLTSIAQAETIALVCTAPTEAITSVEVETVKAGVKTSVSIAPTVIGADLVLIDLATFEPGSYTFRARFVGAGGWPSDWSDPFVSTKPGKPGGLTIQAK